MSDQHKTLCKLILTAHPPKPGETDGEAIARFVDAEPALGRILRHFARERGSKESQTPTGPGWYWLTRANGPPVWAPVEVYLSRSKSRPVLLVQFDDNNIRVISSLNLPIWGPKLTPPPRIRRGDPRRPCEDCGATEGSTRDQRGFDRCNKCGYPSQ